MEKKVILLIIAIAQALQVAGQETFKLGVMFDKSSREEVKMFDFIFKKMRSFEVSKVGTVNLIFLNSTLDFTDSFAVSNAICEQLENGTYGIIGVSKTCALATIQSYSDNFQVPFITLSMPQVLPKSDTKSYQLYIRPAYIRGLLDVIETYGWNKFYYLYDTDEGLIRLQELLQEINEGQMTLDVAVHRRSNAEDCYKKLREAYNTEPEEIRILMDLPINETEALLIKLRDDSDINEYRFAFLLTDLGIEDMNRSILEGGMNVTGFQLASTFDGSTREINEWRMHIGVNSQRDKLKYSQALVRDSVRLFREAVARYLKDGIPTEKIKETQCRHNDRYVKQRPGEKFMNILKKTTMNGQSGFVEFDESGRRTNFNLDLMEILPHRKIAKIADWNPSNHRRLQKLAEPDVASTNTTDTATPKQVIRRITTVKDEPYVMFKPEYEKSKNASNCGKHQFEGFCIDLAQEIADIVDFEYEICLTADNNYGVRLNNGSWNGMIGDLMRHRADLAVAPITISSSRERVVDFTKPFMSLGISIMIQKPIDQKAHVFSFMDPLSKEIWMCILFAYVGVSVVLFLVSRFSPSEWKVEDSNITNDFTISNSLWYSLGAFMQQGCDISPKAISGRIVGSVWWFFTLIIISSYTANLAAFLTVERMKTPIESAEDLAKQTKIQYGCYNSGTTYEFFKKSQVALYERMYAYMTSAENVFVGSNEEGIRKVRDSKGKYAFLLESTTNEYRNMRLPCDTMKVGSNFDSKGYGIATPVGSDLRDKLTLAVLKLRESGRLQKLKEKWWDDKSECPSQDKEDPAQAELTLNNVAGIFYILICGLAFAVVIAGTEFLYKSILDSRKSKQTSFGSMLRYKARLSFRGSLDNDSSGPNTPLKKSTSTYTYTGPTQLQGYDPYPDTNTHTQV